MILQPGSLEQTSDPSPSIDRVVRQIQAGAQSCGERPVRDWIKGHPVARQVNLGAQDEVNRQHRLEHHARDAVSYIAQAKLYHRTNSPELLTGFGEQSKADHNDKMVDVLGRCDAATGREDTRREVENLGRKPQFRLQPLLSHGPQIIFVRYSHSLSPFHLRHLLHQIPDFAQSHANSGVLDRAKPNNRGHHRASWARARPARVG